MSVRISTSARLLGAASVTGIAIGAGTRALAVSNCGSRVFATVAITRQCWSHAAAVSGRWLPWSKSGMSTALARGAWTICIELRVPRVRDGGYYPAVLEPRRRGERALVDVVQEAYVNGVSTRRVDDLVKAPRANAVD